VAVLEFVPVIERDLALAPAALDTEVTVRQPAGLADSLAPRLV